jgi:hypothetical protein
MPQMSTDPDLFGARPSQPGGFRYKANILSPEEERSLVEQFGTLDLKPFKALKEIDASFPSSSYDFADHKLKQTQPIPEFLLLPRAKAGEFAALAFVVSHTSYRRGCRRPDVYFRSAHRLNQSEGAGC